MVGIVDILTVINREVPHPHAYVERYDGTTADLIMKIKDAQTGQERWIDSDSARVREAYKTWWEKRQTAMSDTFKKCHVDAVSIRTEDDYVKALIALFDKHS